MNIAVQEVLAVRFAQSVGYMPDRWRQWLTDRMAVHQGKTDTQTASTIMWNLSAAMPGLDRALYEKWTFENLHRAAKTQLDYLWAWRASEAKIREKVKLEGAEHLSSDQAVIITGSHQLGMELAALRLSMEKAGAIILEPGAAGLPASVYKVWSRFKPQEIIEPDGAAKCAARVLANNKSILAFSDEPPLSGAVAPLIKVYEAAVRYSPLVPLIRRGQKNAVLWLDINTQGEGSAGDPYVVSLTPMIGRGERCDLSAFEARLADRMHQQWRGDPAGYWWSRKRLEPAWIALNKSSNS